MTADSTKHESATAAVSSGGGSEKREIVLSEISAKVEKIKFEGLTRTKDDIIVKNVQCLFSAENFQEMVAKAETAKQQLLKLGLFKSVSIKIDVSKGDKARSDGYEVVYSVKEQSRVTGGVSTLVGTNEGSMLISARLPNTCGRGEKFHADFTYGTKNNLGWSFHFSKPISGNPNITSNTGLFQNSGEVPWSGYKELDRGIFTELSFPSVFGLHTLRWEGVWRELSCLSRTTAFSVREQAGHSMKSLLKHTWVRDMRDSPVLPNTGYMVKSVQEFAGLGGDAHYIKQEAEVQFNKQFFWDTVVQFSLAGGVMKALPPCGSVHLLDRFLLGGPLTLRGFHLKGVGPHEDGCALGADAYWCSGLHLYTPLPFRPGRGGFGDLFRTHLFLTAGNLTNLDFTHGRDTLSSLAQCLRWSYGAGVVFKLAGIARLELNYCVPMSAQQGDRTNPGLQFGIGVTFL